MDRSLVCTIGHSNRPIGTFIDLLRIHEIVRVIDVRSVPRSRHNPQFNRETLGESLDAFAIGYMHLPGLGGLRHPRADSLNTGWKNRSFRGYADYMELPEFAENGWHRHGTASAHISTQRSPVARSITRSTFSANCGDSM